MTITKTNDIVKYYTLSEVAQRNGKTMEEVWVVYRDCVYNVTSFVNSHPGGAELIMEFAGKDATRDINDAGHSLEAMKELKSLKVGELVEDDKAVNRGKAKVIPQIGIIQSEEIKKKRKRRVFLFCG